MTELTTAAEFLTEIPIIPNRPLKSKDQIDLYGSLSLRLNQKLEFLENSAFDASLMAYDTDYQNNQSVSDVFAAHMRDVLTILKSNHAVGTKIVEVGCGKGEFVELVQADGSFEIDGYDGAYEGKNPAISRRFLDGTDRISADFVVLRHVLEHIQRPHDFLSLLAQVFGDAEIYIEVPDFEWILRNQTFFDITYEHVNYFSQKSLSYLFRNAKQKGLIFGGQYQYILTNLAQLDYEKFDAEYENESGWMDKKFGDLFPNFVAKIDHICSVAMANDKAVFVWGAATKGVMFCHHVKHISPQLFERMKGGIDINPKKAGRYMPSSKLPIFDFDSFAARSNGAELILIANPNYETEIRSSLSQRGLNKVELITL